eukprot:5226731-Alexandrium_andersonii.AAC.1
MKSLARMWNEYTRATRTAVGAPHARMQRTVSVDNTAMPFMTRPAASMAIWPNLPKTPRMLRALCAPAPVTS